MAKKDTIDVVGAVKAVLDILERVSESDRARVLAAVQSLVGEAPLPNPTPVAPLPTSRPVAPALPRPLSLVELIKDKTPATIPQKIALFAFYRERVEGLPRFSREDLKSYFGMAREAPPGNYDRDFAKTVKQGWIHEDGAESYLTSRGLESVEAGYGGKAAPRGRAVAARGKKKAKTKAR